MITGQVNNREAVVDVMLRGAGTIARQVRAVIDTGYNGYLTLPSQDVVDLNLPFAGNRRGMLADGSIVVLDVYLATIIWHTGEREVVVSQAAGAPLIGMALLEGSRVIIDAAEDGAVQIEELDPVP